MAATLTDNVGTHAYTLPAASLTGDDPTDNFVYSAGDIVHERSGQIIGARSWDVQWSWSVRYEALTGAQVDSLRYYYALRTFRLYPVSPTGTYYDVFWDGAFNPTSVGLDLYSLSMPLRSILT